MDELEFVDFLKKHFTFRQGIGIGDDASAVRQGDHHQLITQDILIEGVHFSLDYFSMPELALKSLAVNISDITAMGGKPEYFYLGLGFPPRLRQKDLNAFFRGLKRGCRMWGLELGGGDFSRSPHLFISITMVGRAERPVYRGNARTGDLIGITGGTGESALGLRLLTRKIDDNYFTKKHKTVTPQIESGVILAGYVNAMIDVSDGLLVDLKRMLTASGKGAEIFYERIPVKEGLNEWCGKCGLDPYQLVLAGGEDYVLLFTLSPSMEPALQKEKVKYFIIGKVSADEGVLTVKHRDTVVPIKNFGYDHFAGIQEGNNGQGNMAREATL